MEDDATQITLLRKAAKNILYTVANSNAMGVQVLGYAPAVWKMVANWIDVGLLGLLLLGLVLAVLKERKLKATRK